MNKIIKVAGFYFFSTAIAFAANPNYSILVDAGSSGSRIHVFQYELNKTLPEITDKFTEKTSPGLSAFADNPQQAGESLKNLFDHAQNYLTSLGVQPSDVTVSVLATAGMRLLPENKQKLIYKNVSDFLSSHYHFSIKRVETITGKEEGLYGWLDVNYLAKNFQNHANTIGSIDMGGASTQIAFETRDTTHPEDISSVTLNGQVYKVYSKSFLGLGQDAARNEMNKHPASDKCYVHGYKKGDFDFSQCQSFYTNIIEQHHVRQELLPLENNQTFVAYSAVFYNYQTFKVTNTPNQFLVEEKIKNFCAQDWNWWLKAFPEQAQSPLLPNYCANTIYVADLLYNTYQIKGENLKVADNIDQHGIDWTLGALLNQVVN